MAASPETVSVGIHGAAGRMGRRLVALAAEDPALRLVAALEHGGHELLGKDAGTIAGIEPTGVALSETWAGDARPQVVIDFSVPEAMRSVLAMCRAQGVALVIGTTGFSAADEKAIDDAAADIAVLQAPNMSLGVNLLFALAGQVAAKLGDDYDIEIVEAHHRFKRDAPSGTALGLARAICDATGKDLQKDVTHGREGEQPRRTGEIGMHALRLGDVVGRHAVSFATLGEEIQLAHNASTRDVFVRGALRAARWLADKAAGRYDMKDVLGL
ncbi:MAG: 4-hydroxy-tetrahydrodipicolinate reductase [Phycisphaeraceae bacterium]